MPRCPDCATEMVRTKLRFRSVKGWWCWRCEAFKRGPRPPVTHRPDRAGSERPERPT